MRFATDQKFWRRGQWATSASVLIFILAPVSLATAQQAVVRDLCSSGTWISVAPTPAPIAPIPAPISVEPDSVEPIPVEPTQAPIAPTPAPISVAPDSDEPVSVEPTQAPIAPTPAPISVDPTEIAKNVRCVHPSPIGVRYNPKLTAKMRRQYEDSLIYAKGATKEKVVFNVILSASVDVTTPPPIFYYRDGDRVPYATFDTIEQCSQARQEAGNVGICQRNDGPTFISLTGGIMNTNQFPLGSVSIRCDYRDARGVPQSFEFPFRYTLGAGGYIPYQGKVINELPPRSVVNDISCKVETAEIWENTDVIQYLNAPLNPDLRPSASVPPLSRLDIN